MVDYTWTGIYYVVLVLSGSCGGSRVFGVSSTVVSSLLGFMARSISVIASVGVTSMSLVTSIS